MFLHPTLPCLPCLQAIGPLSGKCEGGSFQVSGMELTASNLDSCGIQGAEYTVPWFSIANYGVKSMLVSCWLYCLGWQLAPSGAFRNLLWGEVLLGPKRVCGTGQGSWCRFLWWDLIVESWEQINTWWFGYSFSWELSFLKQHFQMFGLSNWKSLGVFLPPRSWSPCSWMWFSRHPLVPEQPEPIGQRNPRDSSEKASDEKRPELGKLENLQAEECLGNFTTNKITDWLTDWLADCRCETARWRRVCGFKLVTVFDFASMAFKVHHFGFILSSFHCFDDLSLFRWPVSPI